MGQTAETNPTLDDALADLRVGRILRDDGQRAALTNTHQGWRLAAERAIERLAESGDEFTFDDVADRCGHAIASSPNACGSLMTAAARRGLIRKVGYQQSRRASRHGAVVAVWIGTGGGR